MNENIRQILVFIYFMLVGCSIGFLFDLFRIFRKSFDTSDIITIFEDIIFSLISGSTILLAIFVLNNGEIRNYIIISILIGIITYFKMFSKVFIKYSMKIINLTKKVLIKIVINPMKKFKEKVRKKINVK